MEVDVLEDYCFCQLTYKVFCAACFRNSFHFNLLKEVINTIIGNLKSCKEDANRELIEEQFLKKYSSFFVHNKFDFQKVFSKELEFIYKESQIDFVQKEVFVSNNCKKKLYNFLFNEKISSLMGNLYLPGQSQNPDVEGISKSLFDKFPSQFPSPKSFKTFLNFFKNQLKEIYTSFGEKKEVRTTDPDPGKEEVNELMIEVIERGEDFDGPDFGYGEGAPEEQGNILSDLKRILEEEEIEGLSNGGQDIETYNQNLYRKLKDNEVTRDFVYEELDVYLSKLQYQPPSRANLFDDNFTLNNIHLYARETSSNNNSMEISEDCNFSDNPQVISINISTENNTNKRPNLETRQPPPKKKLKFPTNEIKNLQFAEEEKKHMIKVFTLVGVLCDKFPNEVSNLKRKYNSFFQTLIKVFFKEDNELFCQTLFSSTPSLIGHSKNIIEAIVLEQKNTMSAIDKKRLEKEKKKKIQREIIQDLSVIQISDTKLDEILRVLKLRLPQVSRFL